MAIVALAGPVANFLMATAWALIARLGVIIELEVISLPLIYMGIAGISINLVLALINLIPIPPLDGSRIITGLLPHKLAYQYNRFERFGFLFLLFLLWSGGLGYLLGYPMFIAQKLFFTLAGI